MIKMSNEKPPNWNKLVKLFGVEWGTVVVTWGDTYYCAVPLSTDVVVHESVHMRQQINPKKWWKRYYKDVDFRIEQETEAYREQFKFVRRNTKDRNVIFKVQDQLARDLSGKMYGNCMDYITAFNIIKG